MFRLPKTVSTYGAAAIGAAVLLLAAPRAAQSVASALVQVTNTAANPVPNLDAERLARIPYESSQLPQPGCPNGNGIQACGYVFPSPPTGYRLRVENVSGWLNLAPGTTSPPMAVLYDTDNVQIKQTVWSFTGSLGPLYNNNVIPTSFNQPAAAIFDAGDTGPSMVVNANFLSGPVQYMTLTGYLESCAVTGCPARVH